MGEWTGEEPTCKPKESEFGVFLLLIFSHGEEPTILERTRSNFSYSRFFLSGASLLENVYRFY